MIPVFDRENLVIWEYHLIRLGFTVVAIVSGGGDGTALFGQTRRSGC